MIRSVCLLLFFCCAVSSGYHPPVDTQPRPHCPQHCVSLTQFNELDKQVDKLEARLTANVNTTNELRRIVKSKAAFTAVIGTSGPFGPFPKDKFIVYRRVILNIGYAYNPKNGVFTAPFSGIYYFAFFYHAGGECESLLYLYHNQRLIVMSSDHLSPFDTADNGGNAAVLALDKGDRVYVCLAKNSHVWGSRFHTTFTGFSVFLH